MTTNKFFPGFVKAILPDYPQLLVFCPTCLLVASAVAQVADPILSAGTSPPGESQRYVVERDEVSYLTHFL
jgi:hypothetical protein